jgi:hypothetical protein
MIRLPRPASVERVPTRVLLITAAASLGLLVGAIALGLQLWEVALLALLPWFPIYGLEVIWKQQQYGIYALFASVTLLQLGHLGEHMAQCLQLIVFNGNMKMSHGVFGQLDIETVHFIWNVVIWLTTCLLVYRFGSHNPWLWVAFAAASLHTVEHLYLFYLYVGDPVFYKAGGINGILAQGGMIGSPLARPYLHLLYNVLEVTPFVLAFWDESKRIQRRTAPALPVASAPA